MRFNWEIYKCLNPDLEKAGLRSKEQYESHYKKHGKSEGRKYNIYGICPSFNHVIYRNNNVDLINMNNEQLEIHYIKYGMSEGRICDIAIYEEEYITFIIPSLNRPTLGRTIESLLKQTCRNWKCIIIYDGCEGIEFKDDRISTIRIEKRGKVDNHGQGGLVRNVGIEACNSKWIGFVDDDDTVDSRYVETLFEKYRGSDVVVWRMKYLSGDILPEITRNDLVQDHVGISYCYKNKGTKIYFDANENNEDFKYLMKLIIGNSYIITSEVYYKVNH